MSKEIYADRKLIYKEEDINLDDIKIKRVPKVYHLIDICKEIYDGYDRPTVNSFIKLMQELDEALHGELFVYLIEDDEDKMIYSDTFVNNLIKEQYLNRIKECKHM